MLDDFEIKCQRCGNATVDIKGTATIYGDKIRMNFACLSCGHKAEILFTKEDSRNFPKSLKELKSEDIWWNEFIINKED